MFGCDDKYWYKNKNKHKEIEEDMRDGDLDNGGTSRFNFAWVDNEDQAPVYRHIHDGYHGNFANIANGNIDSS